MFKTPARDVNLRAESGVEVTVVPSCTHRALGGTRVRGRTAVSFNVLAIRSGLDVGNGALYPVLSDASQPGLIALDAYDGPNVITTVATAVCVMQVANGSLKSLIRLRDVKIDVYITDGRLALACEKYDKGGGWVGFGTGAVVALAANAVSKARAASRSRGKVLVGHVRYPWLKAVGASSKSGFASTEAIRLEYSEKLSAASVLKLVELTLPRSFDATLVAEEIARRAAAFRLAYYPDMKPDVQAKFAGLSTAPGRLQPPPKKFAFYQMPTYFHASAKTAFPAARSAPPSGLTSAEGRAGPVTGPAALAPSPNNFCTQCGARNVAGDIFCPQCGSRVHSANGDRPARATSY